MATFYIAQSGQGSADASSSGNAAAVSFFNSAGNWANPKVSGKIGPGDTVSLVGTISSQLIINEGGLSGAPITLLFGPNAKLSNTGWSTNGAVYLANKSYIVIDGGASGVIGGFGGNTGLINGIVENTANGTSLQNSVQSCGIYLQESKYCTVKNLMVRNIYIRTGETDIVDGGVAIRSTNSNGNGVNNLLVHNCVVHDAFCGIQFDYGSGDYGFEFYNNTVFNCNWGIAGGDRGASSKLSGVLVHHNYVYNWTNWNETGSNAFHHNGVFIFADNGILIEPNVHSNVFGPGFGNEYQTSAVYINGKVFSPILYNNVCSASPGEYCSPGFLTVSSQSGTTVNVLNNTIMGGGGSAAAIQLGGVSGVDQNIIVKNNLLSLGGSGTAIAVYYNPNITLTSNNNVLYGMTPNLAFVYSASAQGTFKTLAEWRGLGFDINSVTGNPLVGTYGVLTSRSPAINSGANMSASFSTDINGVARPQGAAWDIGAYEFILTSVRRLGSSIRLKGWFPN